MLALHLCHICIRPGCSLIIYNSVTFMEKYVFLSFLIATTSFTHSIAQEAINGGDSIPKSGQSYTLHMATSSGSCIREEIGGVLTVGNYDTTTRCFWEFVPSGQPNRFYIRNLTTGNYIQTTNKAPNSNSKVITGAKPVEFYVGKNNVASSPVKGYWWMSSTDNATFDKVSSTTRGLNKDGSSSNVIVFNCGPGNKNSFWNIVATNYDYEVKPFTPNKAIGEATYQYKLHNTKGQCLQATPEGEIKWQEASDVRSQSWYFVGQSASSGGYAILSSLDDRGIAAKNKLTAKSEDMIHYVAVEADGDNAGYYLLRPYNSRTEKRDALTIDGDSLFSFSSLKSDFAQSLKLYDLPCGVLGEIYVTKLEISGSGIIKPLAYPLGIVNHEGTAINRQTAKPTSWYTLFTKDQATVARGRDLTIKLTCNILPPEEYAAFAYFDWNADGEFESTVPLELKQNCLIATSEIPTDAKLGKSRMRIRITDNGLEGATDDVEGQIIDYIINTEEVPDSLTVEATTASPERGKVSISPADGHYLQGSTVTVKATPIGNSKFAYWKRGNDVISLDPNYSFTLEGPTKIVAHFSPNTSDKPVGIVRIPASNKQTINLSITDKYLDIITQAKVLGIHIFDNRGKVMANSDTKRISVSHLTQGIYIVKVITKGNTSSFKIQIQ